MLNQSDKMDENRYIKSPSSSADECWGPDQHASCSEPATCQMAHEMTMMHLRRLWKVLMRRPERSEFEEIKLCGSKVVRFLSAHLSSACQWVRYAALDLLCGATPRLHPHTDRLLLPLVARAINTLYGGPKEVTNKAIHFLRAFAKHSQDIKSLVSLYVEAGLECREESVRLACIYATSLVFDGEVGDEGWALLLPALSRHLHSTPCYLAAFRALRRVHARMRDARFRALAAPPPRYEALLRCERSDPFCADPSPDAYERKRRRLRLRRAFGVLEGACPATPAALEVALRAVPWHPADLEPHLPDLLALSGAGAVRHLAGRLGLALAPHLSAAAAALARAVAQGERASVERAVARLMRELHPMPVLRDLLRAGGGTPPVLRIVSARIERLPYYYVDLVDFSRCMGELLRDPRPGVYHASKECLDVILDLIAHSPVPDLKAQVMKCLTRCGDKASAEEEENSSRGSSTTCGMGDQEEWQASWKEVPKAEVGGGDTPTHVTSLCSSEATLCGEQQNGFEVEALNPEQYNFNILQIGSPPPTTASSSEETFIPTSPPVAASTPYTEEEHVSDHSCFEYLSETNKEQQRTPQWEEEHLSSLPEDTADELDEEAIEKNLAENLRDTEDIAEDLPEENIAEDLPEENIAEDLPDGDIAEDLPEEDIAEDLPEEDIEEVSSYPPLEEEVPPFAKGREIPRTPPPPPLEGDHPLVLPEEKKKPPRRKQVPAAKKKDKKKGDKKEEKRDEKEEIEEEIEDQLVSESAYKGSQWRRDLEYATRGGPCPWAEGFERSALSAQPFESAETAEAALKRALEHLDGPEWESKEEAMGCVLRVARHHPAVASGHLSRIALALCHELANFRQSVAGKAILTAGHLFAIMGGRALESKLGVVVGALLSKSGNRTLAAYFRLVIKSLFQIVYHSSLPKAALAFVKEGSRHSNKASRETAAQFLVVMTETLGYKGALSPPLAPHLIRAAHAFAFDCSPLTRYCGKRMVRVLLASPDFGKLRDHHLSVSSAQNLEALATDIRRKGVSEELLPIHLIK